MAIKKHIREDKTTMPQKVRKLRWMEIALGHNEENNAILMKIGKDMPELQPRTLDIVTHYDSTVSDLFILSKKKFAALTFLTSKSYDQATDKVAVKLGLLGESARKTLLDTLNEGPESWLADKDFFEKRGLIRGQSKYYVMSQELGPNSDFQKFRALVQPSFQPILNAGIDCVCSSKAGFGLRIQPRVLSYIAAQLMPEGKDKAKRFELLRERDASGSGYTLAIARSELAVLTIAKSLEIDISDVKLLTVPAPIKRVKIKTDMDEAAKASPAAKKEITLSTEFNFLKSRGEITVIEERAYLLIQQKKEAGRTPSAMEIQSLLTRGSARVSLAEAASFEQRIDRALDVLRKDINGNPSRFQPR